MPYSHVVDIEQKLTKFLTLLGNLVYSGNICVQGDSNAETFCGNENQKVHLARARSA